MGVLFLVGVVVAIAIVIKLTATKKSRQRVINTAPKYIYSRKDALMTDAEAKFFYRLQKISEDRYFVFPQIHLSALLKNETKGRYWKAAFQRINRASVDYVLVHKDTLQVAYAVELDDWSHDDAKRRSRDSGIEKMLGDANIPLVRFRNVADISDEEIMNAFRNTKRQDELQ